MSLQGVSLRVRAKEKYIEIRSSGIEITNREFSLKSKAFFDEFIPRATVDKWSVHDHWRTSLKGIIESDENQRYMQLLENSFERAENASTPAALSNSGRALSHLMTHLPRELTLEYRMHIQKVRDKIFMCANENILGVVAVNTFASLMQTYSSLASKIMHEAIPTQGVDADALILGLEQDEKGP